MEASAVHHPAGFARLPVSAPLLRLRSDDQLVAQFRAGNDAAFDVLHDRYRQRLFAYVRQMLTGGSRQDAEDVMQDVFVRAYGALRADTRDMNVRAWLYRVAHNRCIDHLRRPVPPAAEVYDVSRKPLHDPVEEAQRREDLARLVEDIGRLPEQQRSALLMRELDGMSYQDLAGALDVTVPAVKSLLVRARVGLVDSAEARDADCEEIRTDLVGTYDRGVKASSRARRHLRTCTSCREYRDGLRGVRRSFAALSPAGFGPLAVGAKLLGLGGAGGGAAAGGTAAAGGSAAGGALAAGSGIATVTACKVAAVVCTAAITAGGAVEANQIVAKQRQHSRPAAAAPATSDATARPMVSVPEPIVAAPRPLLPHGTTAPAADHLASHVPATGDATPPTGAEPGAIAVVEGEQPALVVPEDPSAGGTAAPDQPATQPGDSSTGSGTDTTGTGDGTATGDGSSSSSSTPPGDPSASSSGAGDAAPPPDAQPTPAPSGSMSGGGTAPAPTH